MEIPAIALAKAQASGSASLQQPTCRASQIISEGEASREFELIWWPDLFSRQERGKLTLRYYVGKTVFTNISLFTLNYLNCAQNVHPHLLRRFPTIYKDCYFIVISLNKFNCVSFSFFFFFFVCFFFLTGNKTFLITPNLSCFYSVMLYGSVKKCPGFFFCFRYMI